MAKTSKPNFGKARKQENWEVAKTTGFAPQWKPNKKGEDVIFTPVSAEIIPKGRNMDNEGVKINCKLRGGSSEAFFRRDTKVGVANGEPFSISLSFALQGDDGLGVHEPGKGNKRGTCRLSRLAEYIRAQGLTLRCVFEQQQKIGKRRLNIFNLYAPTGAMEAAFSTNVVPINATPTKKSRKK